MTLGHFRAHLPMLAARWITVGNALCIIQLLVAIGILTQPITTGSSIVMVVDFTRGQMRANSIAALFIVTGLVGLNRAIKALATLLISLPLLLYGYAVVVMTFSRMPHNFTAAALWGGLCLLIIAYAYEQTRYDRTS